MKFQLEPYHRNVTKEEVLEDIRRVAAELQKATLTKDDYKAHGKFSPSTAIRKCDSWLKALAEAGLSHTRPNIEICPDEFIPDLQRVAKKLGKNSVTTDEYKEHGRFSPNSIIKHFDKWFAALDAAGLDRTRTLHVTDEDYFENLERIWVHLGRQPRLNEIRKPFSRYSSGAYVDRFVTWRKALEAFISFVNDDPSAELEQNREDSDSADSQEIKQGTKPAPHAQSSWHISWRLQFRVMQRDNHRCQCCGDSPVLTRGTVLECDHIIPWSKGGPTTMDNLQTLCRKCNSGKSNLPMTEDGES